MTVAIDRHLAKGDSRWRWLRHPLVALIAEFLILAIPLNAAYGYALRTVGQLNLGWGLLFASVAALVACNGYVLYARYVARRDAEELAARRIVGLPRGLALGALLICAIVAAIGLSGDLNFSLGGWPALAGLPGVAVLAGVYEELIARGVVLRNLENLFGSETAIVLSALLFGALHIGNPNWGLLNIAAVAIEGGVMLAAVYIATRSLWWTIGVHMAWNFTQTTIFGIADSGHEGHGLLRAHVAGPAWLTGGVFGIEASIISVALCVIVATLFLARAYRDKRIVAPIWKRNQP